MLREASDQDRDLILRWRNHPRVREASFHPEVISANEHLRWWQTVPSGGRQVLIFEWNACPAGVVQFGQIRDGAAVWGFFLDVDGLGEELLPAWMRLEGEALGHAFGVLGLTVLRGETLVENVPVRALHKRFGFTESATFFRAGRAAVTTELHIADWRPMH
jgi:RimJ/RimL family protein N-acetyltransferase